MEKGEDESEIKENEELQNEVLRTICNFVCWGSLLRLQLEKSFYLFLISPVNVIYLCIL